MSTEQVARSRTTTRQTTIAALMDQWSGRRLDRDIVRHARAARRRQRRSSLLSARTSSSSCAISAPSCGSSAGARAGEAPRLDSSTRDSVDRGAQSHHRRADVVATTDNSSACSAVSVHLVSWTLHKGAPPDSSAPAEALYAAEVALLGRALSAQPRCGAAHGDSRRASGVSRCDAC